LREAREVLDAAGGGGAGGVMTPNAGRVSQDIAARMAPEDPSLLPGTSYRIGRKLGEGANGIVFEAEHVELGRKVALKVLSAELAAAPAAVERFRREARAVASLTHPNLVQLYDFGRSLDGRAFLAMELCDGETLDARLRRGPLGWREAVRIAIETAQALEAAHAAGLVHRDIKPQNLMLTGPERGGGRARERERDDGAAAPRAKLLDFGIATALSAVGARAMTAAERSLHGFAVVGTPEYMAPEQVSGEPVDRRTDLYALGCVLYEMLTGVRAFDGPSTVALLGQHLRETPVPPRTRSPSRPIPRAVEAVVVRAMAKRPEGRYPTATAMRFALESALLAPTRRRENAGRVVTGVLSAAAMLAAAAGAAQWERARDRATAAAESLSAPATNGRAASTAPGAGGPSVVGAAATGPAGSGASETVVAAMATPATPSGGADVAADAPSPSLSRGVVERGERAETRPDRERAGLHAGDSRTDHADRLDHSDLTEHRKLAVPRPLHRP
jgi:serine/threonine-protein kinase